MLTERIKQATDLPGIRQDLLGSETVPLLS